MGSIVLDGVDLKDTPPEQRPIHTVFQSYALFPHMTVAQNVAFPLKMAGKSEADVKAMVKATLDLVQALRKVDQLPARAVGRPEAAGGARARRSSTVRASCCSTSRSARSTPSCASSSRSS